MTQPMKNKPTAGVTILEVVVAIFVIMVGLMSALALIISSMTGARTSKNQLIAGNLARQAIEVVRAKRDTNWLLIESNSLDPSLWDRNLLSSAGLTYTGIIKMDDVVASPTYMEWTILYDPSYNFVNNPPQLKVYLNDQSGWKTYNQYEAVVPPTASDSGFRMAVSTFPICTLNGVEQPPLSINGNSCETIIPVQAKIGVQVKATVKWEESGIERSYMQEERIYNWK